MLGVTFGMQERADIGFIWVGWLAPIYNFASHSFLIGYLAQNQIDGTL